MIPTEVHDTVLPRSCVILSPFCIAALSLTWPGYYYSHTVPHSEPHHNKTSHIPSGGRTHAGWSTTAKPLVLKMFHVVKRRTPRLTCLWPSPSHPKRFRAKHCSKIPRPGAHPSFKRFVLIKCFEKSPKSFQTLARFLFWSKQNYKLTLSTMWACRSPIVK